LTEAGEAGGDALGPIEAPASSDRLYLVRGVDVDPYRPIVSGDVFNGRNESLEAEHDMLMVVSHPCSMRAGAHLRPRLQVAPVVAHRKLSVDEWRTGSYKVMPLPDLRDDASFAASFDLNAPIKTEELDLAERVCCLSEYGILVLYQRHIRHLTRLEVGVRNLEPVTRAVLTEIELQDEWNQGLARPRVEASEELETVLREEENAFDTFMGSEGTGGLTLREELANPYLHASVRRAVAVEIERRST